MSIWEQIKRPLAKPDRLSEASPVFQKYFIMILKDKIMEKKFPFYEDYVKNTIKESKRTGSKTLKPLIPEVFEYEKKVKGLKTLTAVLEFAKNEGFEITPQEMEETKTETRDLLTFDPELK